MGWTILLALACIPAIAIAFVIWLVDRKDHEPIWLIALLLVAGGFSCLPAMIYELVGEALVGIVFRDHTGIPYNFLNCFFVIAFAEELFKYMMCFFVTWWNKNFDHKFDGVVYCACASLGFALLENILYVLGAGGSGFASGLLTGIGRMFTSIPGHAMFGIYMGIFYGKAKHCAKQGRLVACIGNFLIGLFLSITFHGIYDYCLFRSTWYLIIIFFAFVIIMDILTIVLIILQAHNDMPFRLPFEVEWNGNSFNVPAPVAEVENDYLENRRIMMQQQQAMMRQQQVQMQQQQAMMQQQQAQMQQQQAQMQQQQAQMQQQAMMQQQQAPMNPQSPYAANDESER